jgi:hypothetical protein
MWAAGQRAGHTSSEVPNTPLNDLPKRYERAVGQPPGTRRAIHRMLLHAGCWASSWTHVQLLPNTQLNDPPKRYERAAGQTAGYTVEPNHQGTRSSACRTILPLATHLPVGLAPSACRAVRPLAELSEPSFRTLAVRPLTARTPVAELPVRSTNQPSARRLSAHSLGAVCSPRHPSAC